MSTTQDLDDQTTQQQSGADETARRELEAGFDGTPDDPQPPTETPADGDGKASPTSAASTATEHVQITREEYDRLMASAAHIDEMRATQERSFGTAFGKIGGIERRLQELQATPQAPVFDFSDEELAELEGDWPQLTAGLRKLKNARPPTLDPAKIAETLKPTIDEVRQQARIDARNELRAELLTDQHDDWREVTASPEFVAHAKAKGDEYLGQLATASKEWDHRFIGKAITDFKEARKRAQANADMRRNRFDSAVNPRGSTQAPSGAKSAEEELLEGFRSSS